MYRHLVRVPVAGTRNQHVHVRAAGLGHLVEAAKLAAAFGKARLRGRDNAVGAAVASLGGRHLSGGCGLAACGASRSTRRPGFLIEANVRNANIAAFLMGFRIVGVVARGVLGLGVVPISDGENQIWERAAGPRGRDPHVVQCIVALLCLRAQC